LHLDGTSTRCPQVTSGSPVSHVEIFEFVL